MMTDDIDGDALKKYTVVETKRHKPCLIFRGYRYVQDKIQNRTIYWRCEDRARCNGRAHQLVGNGAVPVLTIKHNHHPTVNDLMTNDIMASGVQHRHRRRQDLKTSYCQQKEGDDFLLSSTSSTMTSPIKLENHQNRHLQQHGAMVKNLHLSEVITTAAATNTHHYNGVGTHRHNMVDPIEMTKLLSNITTSNSSSSKIIPVSSTMDYPSRLNHFSWEEIEGRYLPVIFRNENDCLQRYTSKMYVENTLFQSESWQRHIVLARSLPPLISYPYTENELKLFRSIVEWHLASFHFKTIVPTDCLIRFEDLLDFYGSLRKLRDTVSTTSFNRPLPPPPIPPPPPPPVSLGVPKQRIPSSSSNGLPQSFELPIMGGKSHLQHRHSSSATTLPSKMYPPPPPPPVPVPSTVHPSHSANYLLQQSADLLAPFSNPSSQTFHFPSITSKSNVPVVPPSTQWNESLPKTNNDKIRSSLPRPPIPMTNPSVQQEQLLRDKRLFSQKTSHQPSASSPSSISNPTPSRETKESGWVQINNVFVPYIVKLKLRENELEKCSTRQPPPQLQREFYVPYEILIKCHIFSDNEFAFKKFLIKATQQDFDIFNNLISNINIFDEKVPEKTFLVNLYHVMIGLQRILYVKFLTTKQPRTQVNKYHAEVLIHKGGTLLMHGNRLVPYIVQNNRFYVPLLYAYNSLAHVLPQAKRGARAPRQYEIDYLNLLFIYFTIDSPPLTSDTLLVDAFSIKASDLQPPIHFRTLADHQQFERNKLSNTLMRITPTHNPNHNNNKLANKSQQQQLQQQQQQQQSTTKSSSLPNKSNKCPPANVVVNPLIHHPSFYGLTSSTSPIKQPTSTSNSVVINPLLLPSSSPTTPPVQPTNSSSEISIKKPHIKIIKYDNHSLNAIIKSSDQSINDSKISIKNIFQEFSFDIHYEKFIQWCQSNLLLPLIKLDDEEKQIFNENNQDDNNTDDDYYVYYRHLNRCIELLNDLKRGTISMTLLPPNTTTTDNDEQQQQQAGPIKLQLAGAKKRKTTIPTTRHILPPLTIPAPSSNESLPLLTTPPSPSAITETLQVIQDNDQLSPELPVNDDQPPFETSTTNDDDHMPVVDTVEEEQAVQSDMNSSLLIIESNECDDGKIHLDDTLPSCSSGYESAAALTNVDPNIINNEISDDDGVEDEANFITRSREHSSSCQSEPITSTIKLNAIEQDINNISPVILNQKPSLNNQQKSDKNGKIRIRSRSPTPRHSKKKRSSDEPILSSSSTTTENTITSEQIEHHLRTLLMPAATTNDQRRTRTRPIKTPTRLVEEIATNQHYHHQNNNSIKNTIEPDTNVSDSNSTSSISSSSPTTTTDRNSNEPTKPYHESCTYNVTISNKPNKLGLTIKKVVQR